MRARPVRFSVSTGLRLCGIAEEPFWPSREELLGLEHLGALQVADLGREPLDRGGDRRASVAKNMAWRSRGMTCVETGSTASPSFSATYASTRGSMLAKVPTAPEMAQVAISRRAAISRSLRALELGIGLRELEAEGRRLGVDAVRAADGRRVLVLEGAALQRGEQRVEVGEQEVGGARELHARQVSSTSDEVMPWCTKRASGPTISARWVRKAMTSCFTSRSIASMRATSKIASRPFSQIVSAASLRDDAELGERRRRRAPRSRTRCGSASRATRSPPSRGGCSAGSSARSARLRFAARAASAARRIAAMFGVGVRAAAGRRRSRRRARWRRPRRPRRRSRASRRRRPRCRCRGSPIIALIRRTLSQTEPMKVWPPKPGLTVMHEHEVDHVEHRLDGARRRAGIEHDAAPSCRARGSSAASGGDAGRPRRGC